MITQHINAAVCKHEAVTGCPPMKLYLGRIEFEELKDLAYQVACYKMERDVTGDRRSEYRGLKIYNVDDESYVAVGI